MSLHPVIIAGDPHGDHKPIIRACLESSPGTLILLGDLDLQEPLRPTYRRVTEVGWQLVYIHGNHDCDVERYYDNLLDSAPELNISGRVVEVGGFTIGGLGGVFKERVWYPQGSAEADARWPTRAALLRETRAGDRWRGGIPFRQRDTIFPEDVAELTKLRCDVLVTHEAPRPHKYGFEAINVLVEATGARLVVHGHHHKAYEAEATTPGGRTFHVRGLGKAEPWLLEMPE